MTEETPTTTLFEPREPPFALETDPQKRVVRWCSVTCPHGHRIEILVTAGPDFHVPGSNVWTLVDLGGRRCRVSPSILWESPGHHPGVCHFGPGVFPLAGGQS